MWSRSCSQDHSKSESRFTYQLYWGWQIRLPDVSKPPLCPYYSYLWSISRNLLTVVRVIMTILTGIRPNLRHLREDKQHNSSFVDHTYHIWHKHVLPSNLNLTVWHKTQNSHLCCYWKASVTQGFSFTLSVAHEHQPKAVASTQGALETEGTTE